jgi:hypothetical protein
VACTGNLLLLLLLLLLLHPALSCAPRRWLQDSGSPVSVTHYFACQHGPPPASTAPLTPVTRPAVLGDPYDVPLHASSNPAPAAAAAAAVPAAAAAAAPRARAAAAKQPVQVLPWQSEAQPGDGAQSCTTTREYIPSALEEDWLLNVQDWQRAFCSRLPRMDSAVNAWLGAMAAHAGLQDRLSQDWRVSPAQLLARKQVMTPAVFSRFVTTQECAPAAPGQQPARRQSTTFIEPLAHGLRHPNALCGRCVCACVCVLCVCVCVCVCVLCVCLCL